MVWQWAKRVSVIARGGRKQVSSLFSLFASSGGPANQSGKPHQAKRISRKHIVAKYQNRRKRRLKRGALSRKTYIGMMGAAAALARDIRKQTRRLRSVCDDLSGEIGARSAPRRARWRQISKQKSHAPREMPGSIFWLKRPSSINKIEWSSTARRLWRWRAESCLK